MLAITYRAICQKQHFCDKDFTKFFSDFEFFIGESNVPDKR